MGKVVIVVKVAMLDMVVMVGKIVMVVKAVMLGKVVMVVEVATRLSPSSSALSKEA